MSLNIKIIVSMSFSVLCIAFLILSSINYFNPSYTSCNIIYSGYIKSLEVVYETYEKTSGIVISKFEIYKNLKFIENYVLLSSLADYGKLKTHYDNSTVVILYKNCIGRTDNKIYYLEDFLYNTQGVWQLLISYSCFFLIISIIATVWFFIEIKIKKIEGIVDPKV